MGSLAHLSGSHQVPRPRRPRPPPPGPGLRAQSAYAAPSLQAMRAHRTAASVILEVSLPSRPSIASVVVAARPDVRPAIANALWGPLKRIHHGLEGWRRNTVPVWAWQDG